MPKKEKVLKKKKVKELKNKKQIKDIKKGAKIKEIKSSNLKSNIENLEGEINEESFSQALQPSRGPVLEQIAVAGGDNLEGIIPTRKEGPEEDLDSGTDYTQLGNLKEEEDKYKSSSQGYDEMSDLDKDERTRRRNLELGRKGITGENSFEFEDESKKYVNKGDYQ